MALPRSFAPPPTDCTPAFVLGPLPTTAAFEAEAQTLVQKRVDAAYDRFHAAQKQTAILRAQTDPRRVWPALPELLHPDLQSSCRKRLLHHEHRLKAHQQHVQALGAACGAEMARGVALLAVIEALKPPPRVVQLCGGIEAFADLPVLTLPLHNKRPMHLEALRPQDVPHPIMRGTDGEGRLFVTVVYHRRTVGDVLGPGVITLCQAQPDPASAWLTYNPQRFMPPDGRMGGLLTPTFPNMAGRAKMAGGPDAQRLLGALGTLMHRGVVGPYTLGPGPSSPQQI